MKTEILLGAAALATLASVITGAHLAMDGSPRPYLSLALSVLAFVIPAAVFGLSIAWLGRRATARREAEERRRALAGLCQRERWDLALEGHARMADKRRQEARSGEFPVSEGDSEGSRDARAMDTLVTINGTYGKLGPKSEHYGS